MDNLKFIEQHQAEITALMKEFQALSLSYILLRSGAREDALRLFGDNIELLEVRDVLVELGVDRRLLRRRRWFNSPFARHLGGWLSSAPRRAARWRRI